MIKGKVTVTKVYSNGLEEIHLQENNMSVRGLGFLWTAVMMGEPINLSLIHI